MPEIDDELIARALRWCAEAGRTATAAAVRSALSPLSWDELLAARALLADPPPTRPLGPLALADVARGVSAEEASARERDGRYGRRGEPAPPPPGAAPATATPPRPRERRAATAEAPRVRRARDRAAPAPAPPPAPPLPRLDELYASEGRAVLERLVRRHGARRAPVAAALAAAWRRGDGAAPGEDDLARLLDAHGLTRAFERRERDELLHSLRAAGGDQARAASAVGLTAEGFAAAISRLGAAEAAASIRGARREELRRRATLSERARLVLEEEGRLADLGLLAEVDQDLRRRLPEHLRALRASGAGPLGVELGRSLGLGRGAVERLAARYGLTLGGGDRAGAPPGTGARRERADRRPVARARPAAGLRASPPRSTAGRGPAANARPRPRRRPLR